MFADRVMETSTTTGTGDITLSGAVTGYRTWNTALGVGPGTSYAIVAVDGNGRPTGDWETGEGWLSGSTTLVRNNPQAGSASVPVSFAAGTKRVFITIASSEMTALNAIGAVHAQTTFGGF